MSVASQRGRGRNSSANLPVPTLMNIRLQIISTSRKIAAASRAASASFPVPKRVSFHSAKVMTPERRMYLAWKAM